MKYEDILVSVIVPAYNHEKYIKQSMLSIYGQTYKNIELIILNDGSKDNTGRIIQDIIPLFPDMKTVYLAKENEGICKTLNRGISISSGNYICFLASDDYWEKTRIEEGVRFLESNKNVGMIFSDSFFVKNDTILPELWSDYKKSLKKYFINGFPRVNIYERLIIDTPIPALTVMIRRECFDIIGVFDETLLYEDDDMWLRISRKYTVGYIDKPLAYYRIHDKNVSNNSVFMIKGYYGTLKKHFGEEPLKNKPFKKIRILSELILKISIGRVKRIFYRKKKR